MSKQTLLIPLDGSAFSQQIIPQVRKNFATKDYSLQLLIVSPPDKKSQDIPTSIDMNIRPWAFDEDLSENTRDWLDKQSQKRQQELTSLAEALDKEARGLLSEGYDVKATVRVGTPAATILKEAEREEADLIAMATHGRSGLNHLLMGSVAEKVLRNAGVPVFIFKPESEQ